MSYIAFDNFLWNRKIAYTVSSQRNSSPAYNLENSDPYSYLEFTDCEEENIAIDCSETGNRKPFLVAAYNTNLTPEAEVGMESSDLADFSTNLVSQFYTVPENFYDFRATKEAVNKFAFIYQNIYQVPDAEKAHIRVVIKDPNNPDGVIKIGILFITNFLNFNAEFYEIDISSQKQQFNDYSTKVYSIGHQLHKKPRKVGKTMGANITNSGLYTRLSVRKVIRRVGKNKPLFIQLGNPYDNVNNVEKEFSTQLYYGQFSKLPSLAERAYHNAKIIEDYDFNGFIRGMPANSNVDYDFEFTEIV